MNGNSVAREYDHALQWMTIAFAHDNRDEFSYMKRCYKLQAGDVQQADEIAQKINEINRNISVNQL